MSQFKANTYGFRHETARRLKSVAGMNQGEVPSPGGPVRFSYAELFLTPPGGIPARTGTSTPWTPGVAVCTLCEYYDDGGTIKIRTTSETRSVYNTVPVLIDGDLLIQVKLIGGRWTIDVDPCDP